MKFLKKLWQKIKDFFTPTEEDWEEFRRKDPDNDIDPDIGIW